MKTKRMGKTWPPGARSLLLVIALGCFTLSDLSAQIIANFDGGDSTEVVDAWKGKGGDGWTAGWSALGVGNVLVNAGTKSTDPLSSGGNYLGVTIANHDSRARPGRVSRQYENYQAINLSQPHTVSFEFRLDSSESVPTLWFFDAQAPGYSPRSDATGVTWAIRRFENGNLAIYNGSSSVSTGTTLDPHKVYRFTIQLSPSPTAAESSWSVMIENLTDATATPYLSGKFYSAQTALGGHLNFTADALAAGKEVTFSIDSIAVIPEPSPMALAACGVLLLMVLRSVGRPTAVKHGEG